MGVPIFKHSRGKGYVPLKEVAALRERGLSDREIITKLKEQGFSYDEIEKGLLQTLKGVVGKREEPKKEEKEESVPIEDIYGGATEESTTPTTPAVEEVTYLGEEVSPELTIEELVEGVVNEKWEVFEKEMNVLVVLVKVFHFCSPLLFCLYVVIILGITSLRSPTIP